MVFKWSVHSKSLAINGMLSDKCSSLEPDIKSSNHILYWVLFPAKVLGISFLSWDSVRILSAAYTRVANLQSNQLTQLWLPHWLHSSSLGFTISNYFALLLPIVEPACGLWLPIVGPEIHVSRGDRLAQNPHTWPLGSRWCKVSLSTLYMLTLWCQQQWFDENLSCEFRAVILLESLNWKTLRHFRTMASKSP